MSLLNSYSYTSGIGGNGGKVGMARPTRRHQLLLTMIAGEFNNIYRYQKRIAIAETCVSDKDLKGKAPDVFFFEIKGDVPITFIELHRGDRLRLLRKKVESFCTIENMKEGFIYDYLTDRWTRFDQTNGWTNTSYADSLTLDLSVLVVPT
jgi:Uma2 family endonuclease